jgi:hypothetical protein
LPTPGNGSRKREYVQGNHGAVERFKRSQHGKGLKTSAVLGYIEDNNSFEYWQKEICSWITDLINSNSDATIAWTNDDLLNFAESFPSFNKYRSLHKRKGDCDIDLIHYLLHVN